MTTVRSEKCDASASKTLADFGLTDHQHGWAAIGHGQWTGDVIGQRGAGGLEYVRRCRARIGRSEAVLE